MAFRKPLASSRSGPGLIWRLVQMVAFLGLCSWVVSVGFTTNGDLDLGSEHSANKILQEYGSSETKAIPRPAQSQAEPAAAKPVEVDESLVKELAGTLGSEAESRLWLQSHPRLVDHWRHKATHRFSVRNINHKEFNLLRERGLPEDSAYYLSFGKFPEQEAVFVSRENVKTLKQGQMPTKKCVEQFLPQRSPQFRHASCAVVGNGGVLKRYAFGAAIDTHDAVFRLNQAPVKTYERLVGSKTTYRVLNNKWTTVYFEDNVPSTTVPGGTKQLARYLINQEKANTTFVVTRSESRIFESLANAQRRRRPDLGTLYMSPHIIRECRKMLIAFGEVELSDNGADPAGQGGQGGQGEAGEEGADASASAVPANGIPTDMTPSTGLVAVYLAMQMCEGISIYGFNLLDGKRHTEMKEANTTYHYFKHYADSEKLISHPHHEFKLEGQLYRSLQKNRVVRLCGGIDDDALVSEANDCRFDPQDAMAL